MANVSNVVRSLGLQPGCSWTISLLILGLITLPIARLATYTQAAQAQLQTEDKPLIRSDRDGHLAADESTTDREPAELTTTRGSVWCATCGHQNSKRASACSLCRDNLRSEVSWDCAESVATRLAFGLLNEPITEVEPGMYVSKSEKALAQPARMTTITPAMSPAASERVSRCDTNHVIVKSAAPMLTRSYSNLCADKAGVPNEVTKAVWTKQGRYEVIKPRVLSAAKKCGHSLLGDSLPAAAAV